MRDELRIIELEADKRELLRLLAATVDRAGGEVLLSPNDLAIDRTIEKETVGFTGIVRLRSERK